LALRGVGARFFLVSLLDALLLWLTGWLFVGCLDSDIPSYCRRRDVILRIRKDHTVTNPTVKLLSGRRRISGHRDHHFALSTDSAVDDRQSTRGCGCRRLAVRLGRGFFHASVLVVVVVIVASSASGRIRCLCELGQESKERRRLTDEQAVRGQGIERGHCSSVGLGRTNDRADRERALKEYGGFGHDQVGLQQFTVGVEVGKNQTVRGVGEGRRIAGFVLPSLEVHNLGSADAEQNSQHLRVGDPLRQRGVEARTTLLNEGEVEAGRVGDRL
jgi:hypothetical protein